jgi:hypothetical protein
MNTNKPVLKPCNWRTAQPGHAREDDKAALTPRDKGNAAKEQLQEKIKTQRRKNKEEARARAGADVAVSGATLYAHIPEIFSRIC